VVIENYPEDKLEEVEAVNNPEDPKAVEQQAAEAAEPASVIINQDSA